eukprot:GHVS01069391.1.p2 GENE.GHVS01069391.1~~GHVS01069391.1.p2  ORF type:complete len:121 (+),score=2.81 GHVS01069391.1:326-688(+)
MLDTMLFTKLREAGGYETRSVVSQNPPWCTPTADPSNVKGLAYCLTGASREDLTLRVTREVIDHCQQVEFSFLVDDGSDNIESYQLSYKGFFQAACQGPRPDLPTTYTSKTPCNTSIMKL